MKPVKNSLISIGIVLFFIIALNIGNNVTSAYASPATTQPTVTEVFADRLEAHTFDSIYFTIHVSSGGMPVPTGDIHLYESSTAYETKIATIVDGVAVIEYVVIPDIPSGWRTFVAEYVGTADYESSVDTTDVSISNTY
ncbi:MAG: Ig-like domain-containing protein, partial [Candidatus Thorarchaeota archaeon]